MTLGFYWDAVVKKWTSLKEKTRRLISVPILIIAAATLAANILMIVLSSSGLPGSDVAKSIWSTLGPLFNKEALSPLRILLFLVWFALGFYVFNRFESVIKKWFGWILIPFGNNSLYVYIMHAIILFFAHLILAPDASNNIFINAVGSVAIILLILLAVHKRFLFKIIPR